MLAPGVPQTIGNGMKNPKSYDKIGKQIYLSRKKLEKYCQELKPFSHPFYWAVFTCTRIR